jgi:hypothetical protein
MFMHPEGSFLKLLFVEEILLWLGSTFGDRRAKYLKSMDQHLVTEELNT